MDGAQRAGRHTQRWDGRDHQGRLLPAGTYFLRLEFAGRVETQKISLLRLKRPISRAANAAIRRRQTGAALEPGRRPSRPGRKRKENTMHYYTYQAVLAASERSTGGSRT